MGVRVRGGTQCWPGTQGMASTAWKNEDRRVGGGERGVEFPFFE